jgi:hypothetical protein
MSIVLLLLLIALIVLQILVVVKMFKNAGVLHGILGLICGLYAFIWGWMNANKLGIKNLMLIWTALIILYIILSAVFGASFSFGGVPGATTTP